MRYATIIVRLDQGTMNALDPFALPLPSHTGDIIALETRRHLTRLEALHRTFRHNSGSVHRDNRWMIAMELERRPGFEIDGVWLEGEEGHLEATVSFNFRFMSPSIEESEVLEASRAG